VNVGLTLEAMTDGLCKANVHRVIFPAAAKGDLPKNRKTIAYFSTPDHDIVSLTMFRKDLPVKVLNVR
jgi:isopenicillin N synthase-like dioxygenase